MRPLTWVRLVVTSAALLVACRPSLAQSGPRAPGKRPATRFKATEVIFQGGLKDEWQDFGWAPRVPHPGGPEKLDFSNYGGWIVAKPGLKGMYGGLTFRFLAAAEDGDFFEVRVDSTRADVFPRIRPGPEHRRDLPDGWSEVFISMDELDPEGRPFDRVVLRAVKPLSNPWVQIDNLVLTWADPLQVHKAAGAQAASGPAVPVTLTIDCKAKAQAISPLIYGIAYSAMHNAKDSQQWKMGATARRWGGNPTSRYNWELGNAWNAASDYFFRNLNYSGRNDFSYDTFLDENIEFKVKTALTVPMLGWVAKDTQSASFPVADFGPQQQEDGDIGAGNGLTRDGKKIEPGSQSRTSVAASPEFIARWLSAIRKKDQSRGRSVHLYILDNEPMLWHDTHRDVHPRPATYDELLAKTVAYGTAIRKADPAGLIAGPAEWGWTNYFHSALDSETGVALRPDRRAHGDVPLIPWYLKQLAAHEKKTGVKLLDVLDLHFYPQAKGLGLGTQGKTDAATAALRIRSTRALWDPSYHDESWIDDNVQLLPRMKQWVAENYPGLGISIGEYNFGAEEHLSGGLAVAEALGRFGQNGVTSAFYWTYPPDNSPAFYAFRAYRNYDGHGSHFLEYSLPTRAPSGTSLFASRDEKGQKVVAVALNLEPAQALNARVELSGCGTLTGRKVYQYAGDPKGFDAVPNSKGADAQEDLLPPYSMTVLELTFAPQTK